MKPRTQRIARAKPPNRRNRKRHTREWIRAYGSPERCEFVKGLPCVVCGFVPSENAHIETGGMGRKADADKIVPLCGLAAELALFDRVGCHTILHAAGRESLEKLRGLDLSACARETEKAWQEFLNQEEE